MITSLFNPNITGEIQTMDLVVPISHNRYRSNRTWFRTVTHTSATDSTDSPVSVRCVVRPGHVAVAAL